MAGCLTPAINAQAALEPQPAQQDSEVTAYDLIVAMNTLRMAYGLSALVEDPIINAVAQSTAEIMAANQMSWHIGDVSGRLTSAGYGGGSKVWGTENFAVGNMGIDEIMVVWSDESHMIPAVNPAYCNVGAGVAQAANGMYYYVLQAAYTANKSCGEYKSPSGSGTVTNPTGSTTGGTTGVSQLVLPVKLATPDTEGKIFHTVEAGQSFWAIAVAYQITIKDLESWNNLSSSSKLQIGQKLFIPSADTAGYATPTPVGMVMTATPGADGRVVHEVQTYQTLSTISQAYGITVERLLLLNGWQEDWPLQIGQKLLVDPGSITPSPTPRPLTPIEMLTPDADGAYYHVVAYGETLSGIATYYGIDTAELMTWNGMDNSSILQLDQKLLLKVTPPATETPTPGPPTNTPQPTFTPTVSASPTASAATPGPTPTPTPEAQPIDSSKIVWGILGLLGVIGAGLVVFFSRKKA